MLPRMLEKAKQKAKEARAEAAEAKSDKLLLTGVAPSAKESKTLPLENPTKYQREGRPSIVFKDVGGKFLDVEDRTRRIHEAERRQKAKKSD